MSKRNKCLLILFILLIELGILLWIRGRYETVLSHGNVYEAPAVVDFRGNFFNDNYLHVVIPVENANWVGRNAPAEGDRIYLLPVKDVSGLLMIKQAQDSKPDSGDYITAHVTGYDGQKVYFRFPADRVYMTSDQMKKLSVLELSERVHVKDSDSSEAKTRMKNRITAIVRVESGRVLIERLLCNGSPVELAYTTIGTNERITYANSDGEEDKITNPGNEVTEESQPTRQTTQSAEERAGSSILSFITGHSDE
jgi:hypothetical protein